MSIKPLRLSTTVEEINTTRGFVRARFAMMDSLLGRHRDSYDLERGERCEDIVVELLGTLGIVAGRYRQYFPKKAGHLIRANQVDIWVRGGISGKIYQLETKTRGCRRGCIFDYNLIAVGGCQTWDEKNAAIATKPGRKPVLGMIIVCENTGLAKVANCLPERQKGWSRISFGHEISYAVESEMFIDIVAFSKYLKTI